MSIKDRKLYYAEKLTNVGEYVFSLGKIVDAEIYLQRAIDIYPIARAKALLATILAEKEKASSESNKSNDSNQKHSDENKDSSKLYDNMMNAEKCIDIADKAFHSGNYEKAERFLLKAIRFDPTPQAKALLWMIKTKMTSHREWKNWSKEPDSKSGNQKRPSNESTERNSTRLGNDIEDAERCINIAIDALSSGNVMKAERFLLKAERIYPNEHAKNLLTLIGSEKTYGTCGRNSGAKVSKSFVVEESVPKEEPIRKESTEEQLAAIRSVTEGKNDYEILGVPEGSTLAVIKKAQRKLTLLLHPDKNREPGAKEAFMTVSEAVERLKMKINRS